MAYIILEERVRLKTFKLNKLLDELKENKQNYEKSSEQFKNEKLNINSVSENSELRINLVQASGFNNNVKCDYYATFTFGKDKQFSSSKLGVMDPTWNEEFFFKPTSKDRILLVEIFCDKKSKGSLSISLRDLESQFKYEDWYTIDQGKIYIKVQFIWSKYKYFLDLIKKVQNKIESLSDDIAELERISQLFNSPFGIIHAQEVESILDNKLLDKDDDLTNKKSLRISLVTGVYTSRQNDSSYDFINSNQAPKSNNMMRVTFLLLFIFNLFTHINRTDFLNLMAIAFIGFFYLNREIEFSREKITMYGKILIVTIIHDLAWFYFNINGFVREPGSFLFFAYLFSIFNVVLKGVVIYDFLKLLNYNI